MPDKLTDVAPGTHAFRSFTITNLLGDGAMNLGSTQFWYPWTSAVRYAAAGGAGVGAGSSSYRVVGTGTPGEAAR